MNILDKINYCPFCGKEVKYNKHNIIEGVHIYRCTGEEEHCFNVKIEGAGSGRKIVSIQPKEW